MTYGFAWVNAPVTFDSVTHFREDAKVLSFQRVLVEDAEPSAFVKIKNPGIGLLAATWNKWAWVSYKKENGTVVPLILARRVGVPNDLQAETIVLLLTSSPPDLQAQKEALATTLKVLPNWDRAFIKPEDRDDPDTALEGRTIFWHINHLTLSVSTSDWTVGEAGTIVVDSSLRVPYNSVRVSPAKVPPHKIVLDMWGYWSQKATGRVDVTQKILQAAGAAGSRGNAFTLETYTGQGLYEDWPEPDANIGGDWRVGKSSLTYVSQQAKAVQVERLLAPTEEAPEQEFDPDTGNPIIPAPEDPALEQETEQILTITMVTDPVEVTFFKWRMKPLFEGLYETDRKRVEHLQIKIVSAIQAVKSNPTEETTLRLSMACQDLAEKVDSGSTRPIGDVRNRQYFNSARGLQSVNFGVRCAVAKLIWGARCVDIEFQVPYEDAIDISTRHSINFINDPRIPGGATGKVVSAVLTTDPTAKDHSGRIRVSCLVGDGLAALTPAVGTADYIDDDYIEVDHFTRVGKQQTTAQSIVIPDISGVLPTDDGIDFFNMNIRSVTQEVNYLNGVVAQETIMDSQVWPDAPAVIEAVRNAYTEIQYIFKPLNTGPHQTEYDLGVVRLPVAQQINLGAV